MDGFRFGCALRLVSPGAVGYIAADRRGVAPHAATERWQSGRSHRTRNAAYGQPYRGFESLPLRHTISPVQPSFTLIIERLALRWSGSAATMACTCQQ